jgi:hypothetical protein
MATEDQQKRLDAAKAQLAANKETADKTREAQDAAAQGKPTPTQEENDLAKLGAHLTEHEADGSPEQPQPYPPGTAQTKQAESKKPAPAYQTRASRPADQT